MAGDRDRSRADGRAPLGAVLAGGRGRRLGGEKATAVLAGRSLIAYPLAALAAAGLEAVVVAKPGSALPDLDCPAIREPREPRHPLAGVVAALREAGGRPLIVLPCDMPFVPPALLERLAAIRAPLALTRPAGRLQPFPARVEPALLSALERSLAGGVPLRAALDALGPRYVEGEELRRFGDPRRFLFNVNDGADLRRAAGLSA